MSSTSRTEHTYCIPTHIENNSSSTKATKANSRKRTYAEVTKSNLNNPKVKTTENNICVSHDHSYFSHSVQKPVYFTTFCGNRII